MAIFVTQLHLVACKRVLFINMLSFVVQESEDLFALIEITFYCSCSDCKLGRRVTYLIKLKLSVNLARNPLYVIYVIKAAKRCQYISYKEAVIEIVL